MTDTQASKEFILRPSWKYFFFSYIFSVLAIPIAGIGLVALYYLRRKHHSFQYVMSDYQVRAVDEKYEHNVDLINIERVELQQSRFQEILEIGTLVLITSASDLEIAGISNPKNTKDILEQAILVQKERKKEKPEPVKLEPSYKPGVRGQIDYLTGLWQQGLLSDEDYREQRGQLE